MLKRFDVMGIAVLATSEGEAMRIARGEPRPLTVAPASSSPVTLRSGLAPSTSGRPIFVEIV